MRPILRQLSVVLAFLILVTSTATAEPRRYSLSVEGLVCPLCAFSVRRNLSAIKGVQDVKVDYRTGTTLVTMTEGATLSEAEARKAIEAGGFKLRSFDERKGSP